MNVEIMSVEDLKWEERLIMAWIRDITADKQKRLKEIRRELKGREQGNAGKAS